MRGYAASQRCSPFSGFGVEGELTVWALNWRLRCKCTSSPCLTATIRPARPWCEYAACQLLYPGQALALRPLDSLLNSNLPDRRQTSCPAVHSLVPHLQRMQESSQCARRHQEPANTCRQLRSWNPPVVPLSRRCTMPGRSSCSTLREPAPGPAASPASRSSSWLLSPAHDPGSKLTE